MIFPCQKIREEPLYFADIVGFIRIENIRGCLDTGPSTLPKLGFGIFRPYEEMES